MLPAARTIMAHCARHLGSWALLPACLLSLAATPAAGSEARQVWRFTHALAAPWGTPVPGAPDLTGQTLALGARSMRGPGPLDCPQARIQRLRLPPEGLFEGHLPAPAQASAQALGLSPGPVASLRITCANGSFDFHQADRETLLLGLDNRVWSLSRSTGTGAAGDSPAGIVQRMLEVHFGHDMGFDPDSIARKAGFFTPALSQALARYFSHPRNEDEVPPINGDPFTNSQEYPTRFSVGRAVVNGGTARVPVAFADGWRRYTLQYRLASTGRGWRVDDIHGKGLGSLRKLLAGDAQ